LYLLTPEVTPLWLLDEPFTALDVDMVARMEYRLREFVDAGGAILMTSHQSVGVANQVLDLSDYMV
jgi:heme exporter protein A